MMARLHTAMLSATFILGFGAQAQPATVAPTVPRLAQAKAAEQAGDAAKSAADGYQLQDLDDPLKPLQPKKPRTASDQARIDGLAWYMTGRFREARNDFNGAMDAYKKAVELYPDGVDIYHALVPLAFGLKRTTEAVQFALKAVELDPDNYRLLRRLGRHMAAQGKLTEAIQLLEKADDSSTLDKSSGFYVTLKRDLAILYQSTGMKQQAADSYEVVFEAMKRPDKFKLDFRTRADLLKNPTTTYERIGQAFLDADRAELAVQAFERAEKAGKGKPGTLSYNLARVYAQTKKFDKALTQLQKYFNAQLQSKGKSAYVLLSQILRETNKSEELIPRLEKMSQKDSRNATLQFFLAEQYVANDRLDDAEKLYKKALASTSDAEGYVGLASVYRRKNQPKQLLENLAKALSTAGNGQQLTDGLTTEVKAISKDEKLLDSLIAVGRELAKAEKPKLDFAGSLLLAKLAAAAKKIDAAVEFYRFALKARRDRAAVIYSELGLLLMREDKYVEAAKVYREACDEPALAQSRPNNLFLLSQAHELSGKTKLALEAIVEARKIVPEHPLLHYQEGWIYYHSQQWDKAIKQFERVITKFAKHQDIVRRCQFSLSNIYVQRGDMKKGEGILEKILDESPDDPSVNNDLGYLWADQGKNLEQAEKMIRKAIKAEPENAAYLDSMGWVLFKLGKFSEALPHLEKATGLPSGGDATIWDHLADCYARLNKAAKAKEAWEKALEAAKTSTRPDKKLMKRIEEKLKNQKDGAGKLRPERPDSP